MKIPIRFDDFPLHRAVSYEQWEARIFEFAGHSEFLALSLHDCYGPMWLDHYPALLDRLHDMATMNTLDQIAAEVILEDAA